MLYEQPANTAPLPKKTEQEHPLLKKGQMPRTIKRSGIASSGVVYIGSIRDSEATSVMVTKCQKKEEL